MTDKTSSGSKRDFEVAYEEYLATSRSPKFLRTMTHVGSFTYRAQTNFLGGWDAEKERRVIFLLQRTLQEALVESRFHNLDALETRSFEGGMEFRYGDPDYGFRYSINGRGQLVLSREPSSARSFHEWYRRFIPSLVTIIQQTVRIIDSELTGFARDEADWDQNPDKTRPQVIEVESASYNFSVAVELPETQLSAEPPSSELTFPNIQILSESLLRQVPSESGSLTAPTGVSPEEFGKIEYQVNRWQQPSRALEVYRVSAPSNEKWRLLVFNFSYGGVTYVPTVGEREPFDQKKFVTNARSADAYFDFFRQRCLCGFVSDVLSGGHEYSSILW